MAVLKIDFFDRSYFFFFLFFSDRSSKVSFVIHYVLRAWQFSRFPDGVTRNFEGRVRQTPLAFLTALHDGYCRLDLRWEHA